MDELDKQRIKELYIATGNIDQAMRLFIKEYVLEV